jgi:hypothetical protein
MEGVVGSCSKVAVGKKRDGDFVTLPCLAKIQFPCRKLPGTTQKRRQHALRFHQSNNINQLPSNVFLVPVTKGREILFGLSFEPAALS